MTSDHPEDWSPRIDRADVRRALEKVDAVAAEQNAEHAAVMRRARLIVEEDLLE